MTRRYTLSALTALFLGLLPHLAFAELVGIGAEAPPPGMTGGDTDGRLVTLVASGDAASTLEMSAWNLDLALISLGGTTGTLTFSSATQGTRYLFKSGEFFDSAPGIGLSLSPSSPSGSSLLAGSLLFSTSSPPASVAVPGAPSSSSLVDLQFHASADASGDWGLFLKEDNSTWSGVDVSDDSTFGLETYTNIYDSGLSQLATITVTSSDYNASGQVEQGDLDLVLLNWGDPVPPIPDGWTGDPPTPDAVNQDDLDGVLLNWGNTSAVAASTVVPEPASAFLLLIGGLLLGCLRRNG